MHLRLEQPETAQQRQGDSVLEDGDKVIDGNEQCGHVLLDQCGMRSEECINAGVGRLAGEVEAKTSECGQADLGPVNRPLSLQLTLLTSKVLRLYASSASVSPRMLQLCELVYSLPYTLSDRQAGKQSRQASSCCMLRQEGVSFDSLLSLFIESLSSLDGGGGVSSDEAGGVKWTARGQLARARQWKQRSDRDDGGAREERRSSSRSYSWSAGCEKQAAVSSVRVLFAVCARLTSSCVGHTKLHTCDRQQGGGQAEEAGRQ